MAHLSLRLLGPFEVRLDGEPVTRFESDKVRALLAYLAVGADRPHRRASLAGLLWPERPEASARKNLRNALFGLRTAIGDRDAEPPYPLITRETIQTGLSDVRGPPSSCSVCPVLCPQVPENPSGLDAR